MSLLPPNHYIIDFNLTLAETSVWQDLPEYLGRLTLFGRVVDVYAAALVSTKAVVIMLAFALLVLIHYIRL